MKRHNNTAGGNSGCNFILTVKTRQFDMKGIALFSSMSEALGIETDDGFDGETPADADNEVEMTTEATVTDKHGRIAISYDETEITGLGKSKTEISFSKDDPTLVSVIRTGETNTALTIEKGKRNICTYETPVMPFEICTYARKVENSVTADGGRLYLDYIVEIRGALAQRTVIDVELRRAAAMPFEV